VTHRALVLLAFAANVAAAGAQEPSAPKLGSQAAPAPAVERGTPAQALPSTLTICVDRNAHECWSTAGVNQCHEATRPHGEVFATVAATGDSGASLRRCWDSLR